MSNKKFGVLSSSADGNNLSLTVKGILISFIPLILLIAKLNELDLTENDLVGGINALTTMLSAGMIIYGLFRKFKNRGLN